jgi:hypothetical protein
MKSIWKQACIRENSPVIRRKIYRLEILAWVLGFLWNSPLQKKINIGPGEWDEDMGGASVLCYDDLNFKV